MSNNRENLPVAARNQSLGMDCLSMPDVRVVAGLVVECLQDMDSQSIPYRKFCRIALDKILAMDDPERVNIFDGTNRGETYEIINRCLIELQISGLVHFFVSSKHQGSAKKTMFWLICAELDYGAIMLLLD